MSGNRFSGVSSLFLFALSAIDTHWPSVSLKICFCLYFKTFLNYDMALSLKIFLVYAAAFYCIIRLISFHETLYLTPFCTNSSYQTRNISFTITHIVTDLSVCYSRYQLLCEMFFCLKNFFVNRFVHDESCL